MEIKLKKPRTNIQFRVSDKQKKVIVSYAKKSGKTVTQFLIDAALMAGLELVVKNKEKK